jgi:hypothetical protein
MARYLFLLLLVALVKTEDECICKEYSDEEKKEIWEFLKTYSDSTEEEAVLPGLLSPLVPCGNCIDNARKKRTVFPEVPERIDSDTPMIRKDSRCPFGYGRIGFRCVKIEALYE